MDENKNIIGSQPTLAAVSTKTALPTTYKNVRYINWGNNNPTNNTVYEINFYSIAQPTELIATGGDSVINLNWKTDPSLTSYSIKRSLSPGGPYTEVGTSTYGVFADVNVQNGVRYYYVVTGHNSYGESANSNEASATPLGPVVQPDTGCATLTITLDTGLEKEYDLTMNEVNSFISWYEGKAAGSGTASYAIDKHDNNKGPFKNRKDYVIFDKILTFEVNEYEVRE